MKFSKSPFVFITLSLILGLVLSNFVFIPNWILILLILLALFGIFKTDKKVITYPIIIFVFTALGAQIGNENYRIEKFKEGIVAFKVKSVQGKMTWKNYIVTDKSLNNKRKLESGVFQVKFGMPHVLYI